ncbi:probable serine/threonine-protein kinase DDB_G0277165 [Argopecten irradians]|uniref:probable serine/threonine-protein kinase DDB_G0277165 n=1 Tax=Argopecten irradians TaxID=31199 RepID=UPI003717C4CD
MTAVNIMETENSYSGNSAHHLNPRSSKGVQIVERSHSAPNRKILQPGDCTVDRLSSSSPNIGCGQPNSEYVQGKTFIEQNLMIKIYPRTNNLSKQRGNKVLPPEQGDRKSDKVFNNTAASKVFDTGINYCHSAGVHVDNTTESMPPIDHDLTQKPRLPSLPFEKINEDDREEEERMEVEEEVVTDRAEKEVLEEKQEKNTCVPVTKFRPGFTVYGTKNALVDMVLQMVALPDEETGIFTKQSFWFLSSEDRREVIRKKMLGRGTFGKVNLYVHDDTDYVSKQMITSDFQKNEVVLTAKLNSPYIVQTYGLVVRNKIPEIIMEYGGQSMLQMARLRRFQDRDVWDLTYQGLCGLQYLDECDIRHNDIKPDNILLMTDGNQYLLKIADFGAAKTADEKNDMVGWTIEYLSPERAWIVLLAKFPHQLTPTGLEESDISGKADIFALALTMMYAYERAHVLIKHITKGDNFYREEDKQQEHQVNILVELCSNHDLALSLMPKSVSTDMRFVLNKMLQGDVKKRCDATEGKNWMNFLSNLAIQQREKGVKIQNSNQPSEVSTVQTQTEGSIKPSYKKVVPHVGKVSQSAVKAAPQPTEEEKGWVKDCKNATMETMANLPSGLKTRMVKRKLRNKLSTGKKIKTHHSKKKHESTKNRERADHPSVIVIDDNDEKDQEEGNTEKDLEVVENEEIENKNGNIPNFLVDMAI